jgi:hypothetical protein
MQITSQQLESFSQGVGKMISRKQLRTKVKRLRGRVNTLRTELSQIEPKYLRLLEQLQQMDQSKRENRNEATNR